MNLENPEAGVEAKNYLSVDEVRNDFSWVGNPEYPDRTEDRTWKVVEDMIVHDQYLSQMELLEMGFAKKEQSE